MSISVVEEPIEQAELSKLAKERFGDLVKAVVDIEREIMVIGGELNSDKEALLLEQGSKQQNLSRGREKTRPFRAVMNRALKLRRSLARLTNSSVKA